MPRVSSAMETAEAIERVYRERYAVYLGAAAGIVGSREWAADVVQESFARALQHAGRFRAGSLEAWIWRIVINCARDAARRPAGLPLPEDVAASADVPCPELVAAVLALPERRRAVVLLRYVAGLRNGEIAEALGIREGTVAATLSQAREALARVLEREVEAR
jgi:RNA polymerase sigma-70 factor (ECF subfamily)